MQSRAFILHRCVLTSSSGFLEGAFLYVSHYKGGGELVRVPWTQCEGAGVTVAEVVTGNQDALSRL